MKRFVFSFTLAVSASLAQMAFASSAPIDPIQKAALPNGAPIETALTPTQPRDTVVVTFMGGGGTIAAEQQGVGHVLFDMLRQGPTGMTREQYKDRLFYANGSISFSTDSRATYLVVKAPPESMGAMLELAREQLARPKMGGDIFESARNRVLTERIVADDDMQSVASYFATRHLFKYAPDTLNDQGSPASLRSLTHAHVRAAHASLFRWEHAFYASSGPSHASALAAKIATHLWPKDDKAKPRVWRPLTYPVTPALEPGGQMPHAVVIDKPNATDNQVYFFFPLRLKLDTPEAHDANVAHEILGGGLTGDLGRILRVERGLTYHASSFVGSRLPVWGVYTFGGLFQTQDLLAGVLEVVEKFRTRALTEQEVALAKESARTDFQSGFELPSDRVFERIRYRLYGLDEKFLDTWLDGLAQVDLTRVNTFVKNKVTREGGHLYIMGDKTKVTPILQKVGITDISAVSLGDIR